MAVFLCIIDIFLGSKTLSIRVGSKAPVPQSVKTSLTAALKQISNILDDNNPNNNDESAACGKLGAFINQVNAAGRRGTLTANQADDLRTQTKDIIMNQLLDC